MRPNDYALGSRVDLKVNKLWSAKTQLTYDYYSLPVCKPDNPNRERENIGQILVGDRIMSSDYQLTFGHNTACNYLCDKTFSPDDLALFTDRIESEYTVNWLVDDLPAAVRMYEEEDPSRVHLERGFPIGFSAVPPGSDRKRYYLFNHIQFIIEYHEEGANEKAAGDALAAMGDQGPLAISENAAAAGAKHTAAAAAGGDASGSGSEGDGVVREGHVYRIVGFQVEPFTVRHAKADPSKAEWAGNLATCGPGKPVTRDAEAQLIDDISYANVVFTYDVQWVPSTTAWSDRWDVFIKSSTGGDADIHWFSIINSLMIVVFLTGMIAMILVRNLYRDIARYNAAASAASAGATAPSQAGGSSSAGEEVAEETGWKLVHGDVFRPPAGFFGPMFLSVFVGSGMQILAMSTVLLVFAVLGFLSPANQGSLLTAFILLFVFMGSFAGYFSARLYKMFKGKAWKRNTLLTAFAFPGTIYGIAFILNLFVWRKRSSLSIPIGTMLLLFALWFGISVPLVFVGSAMGFKAEEIKHPVRVNILPRHIPQQPWYLRPLPAILVGGILPFGAVFIELFFIMSSIWLAQMYYVFGFLFLVLLILIVTCAEISIVMAYFQLCAEDYNWWWRSFLTSGSSALYLFAYSIVYFYTKLDISSPTSIILYFGYMAMASWGFFLLTGSIGFVACLTFVNKIYTAIKVD